MLAVASVQVRQVYECWDIVAALGVDCYLLTSWCNRVVVRAGILQPALITQLGFG